MLRIGDPTENRVSRIIASASKDAVKSFNT